MLRPLPGEGEGYSVGWVPHAWSFSASAAAGPRPAAAVASRNRPCFSEVDKSGFGAGGATKETAPIGCTARAERRRTSDWSQTRRF